MQNETIIKVTSLSKQSGERKDLQRLLINFILYLFTLREFEIKWLVNHFAKYKKTVIYLNRTRSALSSQFQTLSFSVHTLILFFLKNSSSWKGNKCLIADISKKNTWYTSGCPVNSNEQKSPQAPTLECISSVFCTYFSQA